MKQGIHPEYHEITVKMTNGKSFKTRSTYGEEGAVLQLDVDCNTHPAWTGASGYINENASQVAKFNNRFGGLKLGQAGGSSAKKEEKKEEKPAA